MLAWHPKALSLQEHMLGTAQPGMKVSKAQGNAQQINLPASVMIYLC